MFKVRIFWEGHKIWRNLPLKIWCYWVASNIRWKIFSNFVAFSEYSNFKKKSLIRNLRYDEFYKSFCNWITAWYGLVIIILLLKVISSTLNFFIPFSWPGSSPTSSSHAIWSCLKLANWTLQYAFSFFPTVIVEASLL